MNSSLFDLLRCPLHPDTGPLHQRFAAASASQLGAPPDVLACPQCGRAYPVLRGIPDMLVQEGLPPWLERERQQWDDQAAAYDATGKPNLIYLAGIEAAIAALQPKSGDLILDAACGTGLTVARYAAGGARVIGLDLSLASLDRLRAKLPAQPVPLVRGDLSALPFARDVFDKVLCANALQHLPEVSLRARCVQELARVARPNARVVVTVHNYSIPRRRAGYPREGQAASPSGSVQYIYRFDAAEFRSLLAASFTVDRLGAAAFRLPYRWKLSPLSRRLERLLRHLPVGTRWGNMLLGVGRKSSPSAGTIGRGRPVPGLAREPNGSG
jgi:SAM-dependent methyltransferase